MPRREFDLSDLSGVNGFMINGVSAGDNSGWSISSAGDVNGDGVGDILIGARYANPNGQSGSGETYLVFGHRNVWPAQFNLSSLNGSNGVVLAGINIDDHSGFSVSSGDVNGDGYSDIMIGAPDVHISVQTFVGQTYLVFGHSELWPAQLNLSSLNGSNGVVFQGIVQGDNCGWSVDLTGDINGDGFLDILIGARYANPNDQNNAGETYLLFGYHGTWPAQFNLSSLNGSNGAILAGINPADTSGWSISSAGDVNDDGYSDILIGAYRAGLFAPRVAGETYLVFGHSGAWPAQFNLSSLNGSNGIIFSGIHFGDQSGYSVATAGDVNNDNCSDILIGTYGASANGQSNAGETYLVFGHSGVWSAQFNLSSLNGSNGVILAGIDQSDFSGSSVSLAGDVNEDGYSDILIGAPRAIANGQRNAGETYLVFGHAGSWSMQLNLSSLNGSTGIILAGINNNDQSGHRISSAGDVNGDGVDDVLIAAFGADPNGHLQSGQSYVIFGGAEQFSRNQLSIKQAQTLVLNASNIEIAPNIASRVINVTDVTHGYFAFLSDDTNPINTFTQEQINSEEIVFVHDGSRQSPSYTISAEGMTRIFSDVHPQAANVLFTIGAPRISAPHHEFNLSNLNGVNGFAINGIDVDDHGGFVSSAGDVNADGLSDILISAHKADPNAQSDAGETYLLFGSRESWPAEVNLSGLNATNKVTFQGVNARDRSGVSVSSAGDVNADGFDDFLIGVYGAAPQSRNNAGETYLVFGHNDTWPANVLLSSTSSSNLVRIEGAHDGDRSGNPVSFAGDVNHDGFSDIVIGAPYADSNDRVYAGKTYLLFGHNGSWPSGIDLRSELNGINGLVIGGMEFNEYSGISLSAGDINHDGYDDVIIGAFQADPGDRIDAGKSYVVFGHSGSWPEQLPLSLINGVNGFVIQGVDANDRSGRSVSLAGDVNGDGNTDIMIGINRNGKSECYLIFGHNGSWPATFELSALNGTNGVTIEGENLSDNMGTSLSRAGDVNGDGVDDVIIGAPLANSNGKLAAGKSYVLFGRDWVWPARFNLSDINGINGVVIHGINVNDTAAYVSSAGDVNGDGYNDVIIGAEGADPVARSNAGQSYVIFGGAEQFSTNQISIEQGEVLVLNASNIEVEPNIESRVINITSVENGYFALLSNQSFEISTFTQGQVNNGEIVFMHDGSDQAPSYMVSAQGITRVFSNVHPQAANINFRLLASTTTLTGTTSTEMTPISSTSSLTSASSSSSTMTSLITSSSFFTNSNTVTNQPLSTLLSLLTTTLPLITSNNTLTEGNTSGSDNSNTIGIVIGSVMAIFLLMVVLWIFHSRQQNQRLMLLERALNGIEPRTQSVDMMLNPVFSGEAISMARETSTDELPTADPNPVYYEIGELTNQHTQQMPLGMDAYIENIANDSEGSYEKPVNLNPNYTGRISPGSSYALFQQAENTGESENLNAASHKYEYVDNHQLGAGMK